ncbi:AI-2E family transporter [Dyadobacter jiangsuensis]|uniref:Putative PurR-regulated permease PerM n=1 Tax=Dyadobacter jiangsuensis TaxID=1591085 RepID=A0A2P8G832_9BACT|nr:AI-2E family transporter [Dyadobacter jiangsuensis]PSL30131.1 putative PurR-regulated permease PerM [Dyadobacter jiangsuensis]
MGLFFKSRKDAPAPGLPEWLTVRDGFPFYIKAPMVLIGLYLFFYILNLLQEIIVPFAFAGLIAVLLNPVYNRFQKWKFNKIVAIVLTIFIAVLVVAGIMFFLSSQIVQFGDMIPQLEKKSIKLLGNLQEWLSSTFGISTEKQMNMLDEAINNSRTYVGKTVNTVFGIISFFVLIPLYIFLLLFYKPLILNFIFEVFDENNSEQVAEILQETKGAVQSYIVGLMIETTIVATLNSIALLILGVPYALLLGVIGAILNLIPYIGGIIAIALPVLISFITKDGYTTPLLIIGAYTVIQFLDNNIIVPRVVSSKVSVNALISILVVLLGGTLWGVSGMFLSIPFVAVLKIIFDRIDELKPWGKLLGDTMPDDPPAKVVNPSEAEDKERTLF